MKIIECWKHPRKRNGEYAPKRDRSKKILNTTLLIAFSVLVGVLAQARFTYNAVEQIDSVPIAHAEDVSPEKIAELKAGVVEKLKQCESHEATEEDAVINPTDGGSPSFGLLQFKITTVQHYMDKFRGEKVTRYEALQIAMDEERARELAMEIIFEEVGGVWNWENCANKQNLAPRIEFIRELEA